MNEVQQKPKEAMEEGKAQGTISEMYLLGQVLHKQPWAPLKSDITASWLTERRHQDSGSIDIPKQWLHPYGIVQKLKRQRNKSTVYCASAEGIFTASFSKSKINHLKKGLS